MTNNYKKIVQENLEQLYKHPPEDLPSALPAEKNGKTLRFQAFGKRCELGPNRIILDNEEAPDILGILISLYALYANPAPMKSEPFKGFKDFPNSMPYVGAFATHTEQILAPYAGKIGPAIPKILSTFDGSEAPAGMIGDFSFVVRPLPKISLCYIVYEADEEFPASVTCLFSANANEFLPMDGLADVGEYTSRAIIDLLT